MQNSPRLCCDIFLSMKFGPKHRLFQLARIFWSFDPQFWFVWKCSGVAFSRTFRTVKLLRCASWPVTKQIFNSNFHLCWIFCDVHPSMVICQTRIQRVKSCKFFLCSFKLRQLVLFVSSQSIWKSGQIFYRFSWISANLFLPRPENS